MMGILPLRTSQETCHATSRVAGPAGGATRRGRPSLAVLVPYRDRAEQLALFSTSTHRVRTVAQRQQLHPCRIASPLLPVPTRHGHPSQQLLRPAVGLKALPTASMCLLVTCHMVMWLVAFPSQLSPVPYGVQPVSFPLRAHTLRALCRHRQHRYCGVCHLRSGLRLESHPTDPDLV
jgi:hypothetical protein